MRRHVGVSLRAIVVPTILVLVLLGSARGAEAAQVELVDCTAPVCTAKGKRTLIDAPGDTLIVRGPLTPLPGTQALRIRAAVVIVDGPGGGSLSAPGKGKAVDIVATGAVLIRGTVETTHSNGKVRVQAGDMLQVRGPGRINAHGKVDIRCKSKPCQVSFVDAYVRGVSITVRSNGDIVTEGTIFDSYGNGSPRLRARGMLKHSGAPHLTVMQNELTVEHPRDMGFAFREAAELCPDCVRPTPTDGPPGSPTPGSATSTPDETATATPAATATPTATRTAVATATGTASPTATLTPNATVTATQTSTPVATVTATTTPVPTRTATATTTPVPTRTPTVTATPVRTSTPVETATLPPPPTATATAPPERTPTPDDPGPTPTPGTPTTVSGRAFGVEADVSGVIVSAIPEVVLAPEGGSLTTILLELEVPGLLTSNTAHVHTEGTPGNDTATASSFSTIEDLSVDLGGLGVGVTAGVIEAATSCSCEGGTASCSVDTASISNGVIDLPLLLPDVPLALNPPPNTMIGVPGLGSITLNEQIASSNGGVAEITVNMIHIRLTPLLVPPIDVIIGSSHSDVACRPGPSPTPTPVPTTTPFVCDPNAPVPSPVGPGGRNDLQPAVSGEAFGLSVDGGQLVQLPPQPHVVLPETGGAPFARIAAIDVPHVITSGTMEARTSGSVHNTIALAHSTVTVNETELLDGLIGLTAIDVQTDCTCDGASASCTQSVEFLGLNVGGLMLGDLLDPDPNTEIAIPGIATVVLNEQITSGDGLDTASTTVNAIRVTLPHGSEVIVASAHSDVDCAPAPVPPSPDTRVSGEGYLVFVNDLLGSSFGPAPHALLDPAGGLASAEVLSLALVGNAVSSGTGTTQTTGTPTVGSAVASTTSEAEGLQVDLPGHPALVTADVVTSQASCTCDAEESTAECSPEGTQFLNLVIDGNAILEESITPNSSIEVPGVATIWLNEQVPGGNGIDTAALTVNAVRIVLDPLIDPDGAVITLVSAHADVDCAQGPPPVPTPTPPGPPTPVATCTVPPPSSEPTPVPTATPPTVDLCLTGHLPISITLRYTAEGCVSSSHGQEGNASCSGGADGENAVQVLLSTGDLAHWYLQASAVAAGEIVTAAAANCGLGWFTTRTRYWIKTEAGLVIEHGFFDTSCHHPLKVGDKFGSLEIVGLLCTLAD